MLLSFFLLPIASLHATTCLIDCRSDAAQLPTVSSEIEAILGASIGSFSVDFEETCTISSASGLVDSTEFSPGYYEFEVERTGVPTETNVYHGTCPVGLTTAFDYLNVLESGKVSNGEYTYTCSSTAFIPDGSYEPLSPVRDQKCLVGIQLTPPEPNTFGAAFWTTKQQVVYGFETSFRFRVLHKSLLCALEEAGSSQFCYNRGGRGFAFVIQNDGSPGKDGVGDDLSIKVNTIGRVNLGYAFPRNLAIEFDYSFDTDSNDPNWNHIAVMVPVSRQASESDNSNLADHETNMLAMSDGISLPPLNEGTHSVRIVYDVRNKNKWTKLIGGWYSRPLTSNQQKMLKFWSNSRLGVLSVFLNEKLVLTTLVDVAQVVQADPVSSAVPTGASNEPSPGSAWVGFVAATGPTDFSSPVILDWKHTNSAHCPGADDGNTVCEIGVVRGDATEPAIRFTLRNIGRVDVQVFMSLDGVNAYQCKNGFLAWDEIHPYFLGCQRSIAMGPGIQWVSITDAQNMRSVTVSDEALVNRDFVSNIFLRRQAPEYCVMEHETDYYRLYLAACDCEYCARIFDNQILYSVFYSHICSARYTYQCTCFEVSQMNANTYSTDFETPSNPWKVIGQEGYDFTTKNMQHQIHSICRGCKYDNHCSLMFKEAVCATPIRDYRIGNPLKPTIGGAFEDWVRGPDALTGLIKGENCDCLDSLGEYEYLNTRGVAQMFEVWYLSTLKGTADDCKSCLRIDGSSCTNLCNSATLYNYLHWPAGASCATCVFSSASWLDLSLARRNRLRLCVYAAIASGEDPWTSCQATVAGFTFDTTDPVVINTRLQQYLNGIATHYLVECPGRDFETDGAVCAPNLYISSTIEMQAISREAALESTPNVNYPNGVYYPAWWTGAGCLNAVCELMHPLDCYVKIIKIVFYQEAEVTKCKDLFGSDIACTLELGPTFDETSNAAVFDRDGLSYGYTGPLDRSVWSSLYGGMKSKTLEVWAEISAEDTISDLTYTYSDGLSALTSWGDDYAPSRALDGDLDTFWQSATSGEMEFTAVWGLDFTSLIELQNTQGYTIDWMYRPLHFTVEASVDAGVTWTVIDKFGDYALDQTVSHSFFEFNALRIVMIVASQKRPEGQNFDQYAFGISEFSLLTDADLVRAKPAAVVSYWDYSANDAFDGDYSTWWSTEKGVGVGDLQMVFDAALTNLALVRVVFRRGYHPGGFDLYTTLDGSAWTELTCATLGCDVGASMDHVRAFSFVSSLPSLKGVRVDVTSGATYYDTVIAQVADIEVYTKSSTVTTVAPSTCLIGTSTCGTSIGANLLAEYTNWSVSGLVAGESLGILTIVFSSSTNVASVVSVLSPRNTTVFTSAITGSPTTLSFAVGVNDVSNITVQVQASSTASAIVNSIYFTPIRKESLVGTATSTSAWSETVNAEIAYGSVDNLVDGDFSTDFRTKLSAPVLTNTASSLADYALSVTLGAGLAVDAIYTWFTYRPEEFYLGGSAAVLTATSPGCTWTQFLSGSTDGVCLTDVSQLSSTSRYAFVNAVGELVEFGSIYVTSAELILYESAAVDLIDGEPLYGVSELQAYVGYPRIAPIDIQLGDLNVTGASTLTDGLFTTYWGRTTASGVVFVLDLGVQPVLVTKIEVWFGSLTGVPPSATLAVSTGGTSCDSAVYGSPETLTISPSLTDPARFGESFADPVKCAKISFPAETIRGYNVTEIFVAGPVPSFLATFASSTLSDTPNLFDEDASTVATASGGAQSVLFELNASGVDLWGITIVLSGTSFDLNSFVVSFCPVSVSTAANCVTNGSSYALPMLSGKTRYLFEPLKCADCQRVGLQFTGSGTIARVTAWASVNVALSAPVVFADTRAWDYSVDRTVDGLEDTPWVSEPDVTHAELTLALINDGTGYLSLDPSYASTFAVNRIPPLVTELIIHFRFPIEAFTISHSVDLDTWTLLHTHSGSSITELTVEEVFTANYMQFELIKAGRAQTLNTVNPLPGNEHWYSPIFGINSIHALMDTDLAKNKAGWNTGTASNSDYAVDGAVAWLAHPPSAQATYTLTGTGGLVLAGVHLVWAVPPLVCELEVRVGSVWTALSLTDLEWTTAGVSSVEAVRLSISSFDFFDTVELSALIEMIVYTPSATRIGFVKDDIVDTSMDDNRLYLFDSDLSSNHYSLTTGTLVYTLSGGPLLLAKIVIVWDTICSSFLVEGHASGAWVEIFSTTSNAASTTIILTTATVTTVRFTFRQNVNMAATFTIFEITMYEAEVVAARVSELQTEGDPVDLSYLSAIDKDEEGYTQWMTAVGSSDATLQLDLGDIIQVETVTITWGFTPWTDSSSAGQVNAQRTIEVSTDGSDYAVVSSDSCVYASKLDICLLLLSFRYIRITVLAAYTSSYFGTSMKNIYILWDQNMVRHGQDLVVLENGWWEFAAILAGDGDETTAWLSRRGEATSYVISDLGEVFDIAGVDIVFRYPAGTIEYYWSLDCEVYNLIHTVSGNTGTTVIYSGQIEQFQGRCVKVVLSNPLIQITDPDHPPALQSIFGIYRLSMYHHVGGGGLFGIETNSGGVWGSVFDTITFAPFQPNQWHMLSNQQARSVNVDGEFVQQEIGFVHVVATFSDDTVTLYRNGVQYGTSYIAPNILWDTADEVRLVFGLRSSAFASATSDEQKIIMGSNLPGKQTSTLSPYFSGSIRSVALFSQTLLAEEVMGLYESAFDMRERSCICYDACPTGNNRLYPTMDVPCSGQGVCRRKYDALTGLPDGGECQCSPGFSGEACDVHCSDNGGCCSVDDDCPLDTMCDTPNNICVTPR